jgi:O-antigen/teichoic acid export membrane protein
MNQDISNYMPKDYRQIPANIYRHFMHDSLYRNSIFLLSNTVILALFGFLFWSLAARQYEASTVGVVSSIVSASSLIASISLLGFDYAFIKYLPHSKNAHIRINTGLTISAIVSILSTILFIILIPRIIPELDFLYRSYLWLWILSLFSLMVLSTWNILTNAIFIAFRIAQFALITSIVLGLIRVSLLILLNDDSINSLMVAPRVIASLRSVKEDRRGGMRAVKAW